MIYDQSDIGEVALMIDFCKSGQKLLVYGCQENQLLLAKYLKMSGIRPDGFLITQRLHWEYEADGLPVYTLEELNPKGFAPEETSILLALPGKYYNEVLCRLQSMGYGKIFYGYPIKA